MNIKRVIKLFCFVGLLNGQYGYAEQFGDAVEWVSASGNINWSQGQVVSEGVGLASERVRSRAKARILACRAAIVDAQRNLLETTKGVRIESETMVENYMLKSDRIRTRVSGIIKGARLKSKKIESDGTCVVKMVMPMEGKLASTIYAKNYSDQVSWNQGIQPFLNNLASWFPAAHAGTAKRQLWQVKIDDIHERLKRVENFVQEPVSTKKQAKGEPTGLIINASGSNFLFSMSPKLRQLRGGVLYPTTVNKVDARKNGRLVSLFMSDLNKAKSHARIGSRPVVVKALRTYGKTRTDIVLGKDASKVLANLIRNGFLDNAEVIIVMN